MRTGKLLAACLFAVAPSATYADVTVGILAPLTGRIAAFGTQYAGALKVFEDESRAKLNAKEKMKFVVYDTRGDLTETINLTRRLISSDKAVVILGPLLSGEAEVAFPVAVQGKTPIISPTASKPGISAANRPYGFTFAATAERKAGVQVEKWLATAGKPIKKVVIIMDSKDAISKFEGSVEYPKVLKQHGVEVLETISIQTGDLDFSAPVTRAKNRNPDGVVITMLHSEGGNLMRELRKQGMQQPVAAGIGVMDQHFLDLAGPAAEGVVLSTEFYPDPDSGNPAVNKWVVEYVKKNKQTPTTVGAQMYDTLEFVRSCIISQRVTGKESDLQSDRDKMQKCVGALKGQPIPLTGTVSMNARGEAVRDVVVMVVRNGQFKHLR